MGSESPEVSIRKGRVLAAGFVGNVLEWYDFAVYGFFAETIGKLFFPSGDRTLSLIASFGAFAAGFLMRPFGSVLFGYIGDRVGRKVVLTLSVMMMAVPTFLLGLLPTNPTSGGIAGRKRHVVNHGESLPLIAAQNYGHPGLWRAIADANGIDDPFRTAPGSVLFLPSVSEISAARG